MATNLPHTKSMPKFCLERINTSGSSVYAAPPKYSQHLPVGSVTPIK